MDKTKKKLTLRQRLRCLLLLIFMLALIVPLVYFTRAKWIDCQTERFDTGWDAEVHGKSYSNITISETLFGMCNEGDVLTISRQLPKDSHIPNPVLQCYSVQSIVEVYLDEKLIYSYGQDIYEEGLLLGYGMNYVELPEDYAGKELKIVYTVCEDNAFEGLPQLTISDGHTLMEKILSSGRFSIAIAMFLIMFGVICMALSIFMLVSDDIYKRTFCIAAFSFLLGCWTLCSNDLLIFFVKNMSIKVYIEYFSFYLLPLPFTYYFKDFIKQKGCPKAVRIYFWVLIAAELALVGLVVSLQAFNLVPLPRFIGIDHILLLFLALFVVLISVVQYRKNRKLEIGVTVGFGLAMVTALFELIHYNLDKYKLGVADNNYGNSLSFAALFIVIALFADFGGKITTNLYQEAQNHLLARLAYVDELTTLSNRRRCDEVMAELKDVKQLYAIVSMDMNLLKYINDTYGHEMGDYALQQFADVLKNVFPETASVGRMGGDEFIVILPDTDRKLVKGYIASMVKEMEDRSRKEKEIILSSAYGCAFSDEGEDVQSVYALADERMYECKRAMKMERKS